MGREIYQASSSVCVNVLVQGPVISFSFDKKSIKAAIVTADRGKVNKGYVGIPFS